MWSVSALAADARRILAIAVLAAGTLAGIDSGVYEWQLPRGFPQPRVPAGNPMSEEKARLGRYLFYDKRLSANGTQSCATCHRQELAFTDGRATSTGATGQNHPRSAMSLVNVAYSAVLTWANPALRSLEEQALIPMFSEHPVELGLRGHEDAVLDTLRREPVYCDLFPRAFPESKDAFTMANVARALATFERTIISARSPYDRFHLDGERDAISEAAKRGETLFFSDPVASCFRCHGGFNFSDAVAFDGSAGRAVQFHNTALYRAYAWPNRGIFEHTRNPSDAGKFKAPSLRNIALTAPYMHDGSITTLEAVLDHYAAGGRAHDNPNRDPRLRKIDLTPQNRADLLAFLRALTDEEVLRDPRFSNPW
jgi:cytochrome c peroxidase